MAKPVLLTVDDDPEVLRAVERDLRLRYAERYRVLRADSGATALEALRALKRRGDSVVLLLVDQRMPQMNGVDFLAQAMEIFPNAKRVLLTAYADTDAAIRAINDASIHHYLLKPWDPPEEHLYPVLDDLLDDWMGSYRPPMEGVRVLGTRWSPHSYAIRDFLTRNQTPYQWIDVEKAWQVAEVRRLVEAAGAEISSLPKVLFPDGTSLADQSVSQLAEKLGLRIRPEVAFYDLVIVGGGPAGLAAAVYGASEGLSTVLIEMEAPGGHAGMSSRIENYLGFPSGLSGGDLARRGPGPALRSGDSRSAAGYRSQCGRLLEDRQTGGGIRYWLQSAADRDGRYLSQAGRAWGGAAARVRRLLWLSHDRGDGVSRRGGLHCRGRKLGRAGRDVLFQVCATSGHAGAGRIPLRDHVSVPDRPDQENAKH